MSHARIVSTRLAAAVVLLALGLGTALSQPPDPASTLQLEDLTTTELARRIAAGATTVLIPVGGTEQSGSHIALGKHNARAAALAARIASALGNTLVAPVIAYVPEGRIDPPTAHMRYAGTLSVPQAAFEQTLAAAAQSLRAAGFRTVVLLGDHGGYQGSLQTVAARLTRDWRASGARVLAPMEYYRAASSGFDQLLRERGYADAEIGEHAGLADTALSLALTPSLVRADALADARRTPGVTGDPRRATAALGELGVNLIVERTVAAVRAARP